MADAKVYTVSQDTIFKGLLATLIVVGAVGGYLAGKGDSGPKPSADPVAPHVEPAKPVCPKGCDCKHAHPFFPTRPNDGSTGEATKEQK